MSRVIDIEVTLTNWLKWHRTPDVKSMRESTDSIIVVYRTRITLVTTLWKPVSATRIQFHQSTMSKFLNRIVRLTGAATKQMGIAISKEPGLLKFAEIRILMAKLRNLLAHRPIQRKAVKFKHTSTCFDISILEKWAENMSPLRCSQLFGVPTKRRQHHAPRFIMISMHIQYSFETMMRRINADLLLWKKLVVCRMRSARVPYPCVFKGKQSNSRKLSNCENYLHG